MKRWAAVEGVFVGATSITFARLMGATYGGSNHNPYLVHSLRSAHPDLLAADWLTAQHPSPHPVFSWLASWGMMLSDTGLPFVVANLASSIVFVLLLWWLVRLVNTPGLLSVLMLLVALAGVTRTNDAMGSYILESYFQPSTVGGIGFIAAVCAFTGGRYLLSGFLLALLGAFHLNYLALGFAVFGLAHVALGRQALAGRLLRQLVPPRVGRPGISSVLARCGSWSRCGACQVDSADGPRPPPPRPRSCTVQTLPRVALPRCGCDDASMVSADASQLACGTRGYLKRRLECGGSCGTRNSKRHSTTVPMAPRSVLSSSVPTDISRHRDRVGCATC